MVPKKLTGIVRAQCSVAGIARGDDAEVAAAAVCTESSWMAAKHVTINYKALARVGNGSGSSLVNFEAQCCANGNAVVFMPQTLPAVSLHAAMRISWLALSKLICPVPSTECLCWQFARQSCVGSRLCRATEEQMVAYNGIIVQICSYVLAANGDIEQTQDQQSDEVMTDHVNLAICKKAMCKISG